ncbi:MAG: cytochrome P450 [Alphaproteobacteria bacterium]
MNVEAQEFDKPLGNEQFRVERPAHVPEEAVVEIDYHLFGGAADPRLKPGMAYQEAWKEIQDTDGPDMRWTPFNGGHWIPMKGELINEVLQNPDRFSSKYIALPKEVGELYDFIPLTLDPPEQTPYRAILNPLLSHKVVRPKEAPVRALAVDLIEGFMDKGECDYVRDFANILPVATFHELVGLPEEEREELRELATSGDQTKPESIELMLQKIEGYLRPHLKRRREEPGTDLFSGLLHSHVGDRPITDDEAMHMCKQLFVAGFHTTASSMTYAMYQMAKEKWLRDEIASDLPNVRFKVEELLRRFAMVSIPRTATCDTTLGGQEIKEGDPILLPRPA